MLENFEISLPVLALTGGVVLFLVALQTVLQQSAGVPASTKLDVQPHDLKSAFAPLAFPTIVTPYGIAAVIVFATLAAEREGAEFTVAAIVLLILAMDWVAMLFAEAILRGIGPALQVFAVVLGVTQIALGLQVILHSLCLIGVRCRVRELGTGQGSGACAGASARLPNRWCNYDTAVSAKGPRHDDRLFVQVPAGVFWQTIRDDQSSRRCRMVRQDSSYRLTSIAIASMQAMVVAVVASLPRDKSPSPVSRRSNPRTSSPLLQHRGFLSTSRSVSH